MPVPKKILLPYLACLCLLLSACASANPAPALSATLIQTQLKTPTVSPSPSPSRTNTILPSPTITQTATSTPQPTSTVTRTPLPTYVKLRGKVIIDQAVCHYGPGAPYLYKYGVYKDSNLEILRRIEGGNYVEIQAIGGNNPCWVRADYFTFKGDPQDLQPVRIEDVKLPVSPYYAPPSGVSARRDGAVVTVFWNPLILKAGDDSEQVPYIVEAMVCQNGSMVFIPAGTYQAAVEVTDEPGCAEPSYATFVAAEKHGYTRRVDVPWPQADP
jgi:hypothetical protein